MSRQLATSGRILDEYSEADLNHFVRIPQCSIAELSSSPSSSSLVTRYAILDGVTVPVLIRRAGCEGEVASVLPRAESIIAVPCGVAATAEITFENELIVFVS